MPARVFGLLFLFLTIPFAVRADSGKVESIGAFAEPSASDSLKKSLEPKGYRVRLADGKVLCEIWMRNGVASGKNDAQGAVYTSLGDSALIGVITFPQQATDFRKQAIRPGSYTLRYAVHPQDGNHLGISPIRDFLLLLPLGIDQDPGAKYKFEDLNALSKKASGTNHALVISLVTTDGISNWPTLIEDEYAHLVFAARIKADSGSELPIAFVVRGVAEQG